MKEVSTSCSFSLFFTTHRLLVCFGFARFFSSTTAKESWLCATAKLLFILHKDAFSGRTSSQRLLRSPVNANERLHFLFFFIMWDGIGQR